jgi:hypothetical protein
MPKKTRKQKLRADDRHSKFVLPVVDHSPSISSPISTTFQFQAVSKKTSSQQSNDTLELTAIRTDLIRTLALAALAIGTE